MAIPTISTVSPAAGNTGGRLLVSITGTGFQLLPDPPPSGPVPVPNPSVAVFFSGVPSPDVRVLTSGLLHVLTPISDPGLVDVTVVNIAQDGTQVGAETVTRAGGFTYVRPQLITTPGGGGGTLVETDLARLVRALIEELARQVIGNVQVTTDTDFGDGVADAAVLSTLPGLVLIGPALRRNRFFSTNQRRQVPAGGSSLLELRPPYTVDLMFQIVGVDELTNTALNLQQEVTSFFQRNTTLRMLRDPTVPADFVEYEMEIEGDGDLVFSSTSPGNSNLRSFTGKFVVRGLDLDDRDMARVQTDEVGDQGVTIDPEAI